MKNIFTLLCAALTLLVLTATLHAQKINVSYKSNDVEFSKDTVARLTLFTGKYCEEKIYLHWNIANQHADGVYIIFRSSDNEHFEVAGNKQGIGVPISNDIAYYFTDECPCEGTVYYKLLHVSKDKSFIMSETTTVVAEERNYLTEIK